MINLADWGDVRIVDNTCGGFINNDATAVARNTCGVIKNNIVYAQITDNDITGDIANNSTPIGSMLDIYLNRNRGKITFNRSTVNVVLHRNTHNGDIGNTTETIRTVNMSDPVINK